MATTPSVIESGAALAASVPSDFFNDIGGEVSVGAEEAPESESGDETTGDAAIETLETPAAVKDAPLEPVGAEEPVVEAAEEPTPAAGPRSLSPASPARNCPRASSRARTVTAKRGCSSNPSVGTRCTATINSCSRQASCWANRSPWRRCNCATTLTWPRSGYTPT